MTEKKPPTMQSLYQGEATYLDYKKRSSPMKTKEIISKLENPSQHILSQDNHHLAYTSRSYNKEEAKEDLDMVQEQLKYIKQ